MWVVTHYNEITLKNICIFPPGQVTHYNEITLENLCICPPWQVTHYNKSTLENLCIFHLDRLPITMRPFEKTFVFFI
jgi:hypothetical protein